MSEPDDEFLYVIEQAGPVEDAEAGPPGEAVRLPWSKPKAEPVKRQDLLERFGGYATLAEQMMQRADQTKSGFRVEEITLHLGVNSQVGLAFVGQVGIEGAIDVTLRRKPPT